MVPPNVETITAAIFENEDVKSCWCVVSSDWDTSSAMALLQMIVNEWVKIRGFSLASAWVEKYKVAQKPKGVRKQLISKPSEARAKKPTDTIHHDGEDA